MKFKNKGQKPGKKAPVKENKESVINNVDQKQLTFMKNVVGDMRKQGKRRVQMLPDSGAFH